MIVYFIINYINMLVYCFIGVFSIRGWRCIFLKEKNSHKLVSVYNRT